LVDSRGIEQFQREAGRDNASLHRLKKASSEYKVAVATNACVIAWEASECFGHDRSLVKLKIEPERYFGYDSK
jgi:hypothetical protein